MLVLEATAHPGGAVRSAPDTPAPGFTADLYSAFYPLGAASPVLRALDLEPHGLTWTHAPDVLAHVFDDGRAAVLSRDLDRTAASLDEFADGDGAAWRRQHDRWAEIEDAVLAALFTPFPPVRAGLRLARRVGVGRGLRLARFGVLPVRRFVEEEFRGEGAHLLVAGNALHTDLAPESAGGALYGTLLAMVGQRFGFPVPAGGSGRIVDALVSRLVARGGEVRCGAPVERVQVHDGRATGVVTAAGERVLASRAVLADVPAPILYDRLLAGRTAARPAARRPGALPVGRRDREGRLGPPRAGAVDRARAPGGRAPCTWVPTWTGSPATPPTWRPGAPPAGRSPSSGR